MKPAYFMYELHTILFKGWIDSYKINSISFDDQLFFGINSVGIGFHILCTHKAMICYLTILFRIWATMNFQITQRMTILKVSELCGKPPW